MKIQIAKVQGDIIAVSKDYRDVTDKGEISHVLVELERIKIELLGIWEKLFEEECKQK